MVANFTHTINRTIKNSLLIRKKAEVKDTNSLKTRKQMSVEAGTEQ